jgi:hypothetical protein
MFTLMVGVLLVAFSAVVFGLALFGRRPVPQPAMSGVGPHPGAALPEASPSDLAGVEADDVVATSTLGGVLEAGWWRRLLQREPTADHQPESDVTLSPWVRVRSALFLTLIVTGLAALLGILASIVVVGLVLLVT